MVLGRRSVAKVRIPKKVGAFRIPKTIRKSRALKALLASQHGRELLTGAVVAGAAAAASSLARSDGKDANVQGTAAKVAAGTKDAIGAAAESLAGALEEVAQHISPREAHGHEVRKEKKRPKGKRAQTGEEQAAGT
jgi:hypothetical protein